jgi:hypothetical protein
MRRKTRGEYLANLEITFALISDLTLRLRIILPLQRISNRTPEESPGKVMNNLEQGSRSLNALEGEHG